ncbi:hypothetical protein TTHERM_00399370 (macronuclear) [Tetrahymena thermophila SB210]|uniref:XRN2-binding (XTBD) domain-containing protein n=1 Tax=Tetrahymena thermophila (strain SB210) TaxID=312017 RepID=I7M7I0_TETTS|nr:hypothetical protein TTHERM_00399370 [Tetrahymena thermophila SB210]EAR93765.3 hypothetical protein TTHERM_00399370 [Tetrahymena thermophila SB210]|eukprot:XP_001014010.3 hypothetical protein TTHERM_00399370 [Tetrahymena thermophila SB210]
MQQSDLQNPGLVQQPGQIQYGVQIPQQSAAAHQPQVQALPRMVEIPMKQGEVMSQYLVRKQVYKNAFKDLNDHDKAYCYANIYANITFLYAKYPPSLTEKVMKYAPQA